MAERKFPNFLNFYPEFPPEFHSEFSPNFSRSFSCFISQETETIINSSKIPALFQCKIPRQIRKNHKMFLESGQSKIVLLPYSDKLFFFVLGPSGKSCPWGSYLKKSIRTSSTTTRDRNLQFLVGAISTEFVFREAPDTFTFLRHVMRAILSVRPKCSHRCISLKETPLKPVQILKHTTKTQPSKPL